MKKVNFKNVLNAFVCTLSLLLLGSVSINAQTLTCNNLVQVSLDEYCEATIGADQVLEGDWPDYSIFTVNVLSPVGAIVPQPLGHDAIGPVWTVKVIHPSGQSCWGSIIVEDKLIPVVYCPDITVKCNDDIHELVYDVVTVYDNCTTYNSDIEDEPLVDYVYTVEDGDCGGPIGTYVFTWTAYDYVGNQSYPCVQRVEISRPDINDVVFPGNEEYDCEFYTYDDLLPEAGYVGIPYWMGGGLVDLCEIELVYEDAIVEVCSGTIKIIREWTVLDWCAPVGRNIKTAVQVVKILDEDGPTLPVFPTTPEDIDIYFANSNGGVHSVCEGVLPVPPISVYDDCSGVTEVIAELWENGIQLDYTNVDATGGVFYNVPLFQYGIPAIYTVRYVAIDGCGNSSYTNWYVRLHDAVQPIAVCDEITQVALGTDGLARVFAETFDDGSYDNCYLDRLEVRRMGDNCAINGNTTFDDDGHPNDSSTDPDDGAYVTFCCDDIGETVMVVLRVFDGSGNYNECMVEVLVEDKLPPVLTFCPSDYRIDCDYYADNLETQLAGADGCDVLTDAGFGYADFFDNCEAIITCEFSSDIDQCLEGYLKRTWTAVDPSGNAALQDCEQYIWVDHVSDWVVEFPADILEECGTTPPDFGAPEIFYETCELVAISFEDELFNDVPDACYKILRTWTVINWCVVGADIDEERVEDSEYELIACLGDEDCDLDGDGDCDNRTYRDTWSCATINEGIDGVDPTHNTAPFDTDDTAYDSDPWDGYITHQQVIKVNDTVDPVFTNGCQIDDVCIGDNTCYATVVLPTPDITECSADVDFTVQILIGGAWLNGFGPYFNVPPGTYDVRYVAMDNCNNQAACESTVTVVDCKKPTPYCKAGIVVELMVPVFPDDEAMVVVWASDLNDASFDNCPGDLKFSFSSDISFDNHTFDCDDLGPNGVEMWVTDAAGNQDFCITNVIIQANMGQCSDDPLIAGVTETEMGEGVSNVNININSPSGFDATMATDDNGVYTPSTVPTGGDYSVTPAYDEYHLNGVTTYDLVMISKHILGVDLLDSPYQIIAADANKSNTVTTFDLVEIRKLILFIHTEFPNNTSWRFVDKDFSFTNPANPFAVQFPEVINLNNLDADELAADFIAIKVGDVNRSAAVNLTSTEDRNMVGDLVLNTDDVILTEGETYTVKFKATDFAVSGYQFSMNFDNKALDFEGVVSGLASEANFGMTMVNDGVITTSWNNNEVTRLAADEVVFGLTFTAKQSGRLSNMLNVNSRYTVAEAYNADAELLNVALSFNNTLVANGFELYQNTPNPFASTTAIGFYLPEATSATLTISDVQGKVVKVISKDDFVKGYNQVTLKRSELGATGVLYYRLDTDNESATRKMILVD